MPIRHLQDRRRYIRLGKIRTGVQVPVVNKQTGKPKMRDGKPVMRPQATDYFVVKPDIDGLAELVAREYGDKPTEFDISFLFERDQETFPQFLKHYRGDRVLRCIGDGYVVLGRRFLDKERNVDEQIVSNGLFLASRFPLIAEQEGREPAEIKVEDVFAIWEREYGVGMEKWGGANTIPCLGPECPQYKPTGCRPTGRLLFAIRGIERLGFWELVVHQHSLVGINSQLELTRAFTAKFLGRPTILHVPFKLRLRGPIEMKVNGFKAKWWAPEIEPDPTWITDVVAGAVELPELPARAQVARLPSPTPDEGREDPGVVTPAPEDQEPLDYDPTAPEDMEPEQVEMPL